jgi:hypothetical protein
MKKELPRRREPLSATPDARGGKVAWPVLTNFHTYAKHDLALSPQWRAPGCKRAALGQVQEQSPPNPTEVSGRRRDQNNGHEDHDRRASSVWCVPCIRNLLCMCGLLLGAPRGRARPLGVPSLKRRAAWFHARTRWCKSANIRL